MSEASQRALEILEQAQDVSSGSRRVSQHQLSGVAQLLRALRESDSAAADVNRPGLGLRIQRARPIYE